MSNKLFSTIIVVFFLTGTFSLTFSVSPANAAISGKFGNALEFNGINDYVMVPDSSSLRMPSTQLTLEAWVYLPSNSPGLQLVIRKWIDADGGWMSYVLGKTVDNKIYGAVGNKDLVQYPGWTTTQTITELGIEDTWSHVAFSWKKEAITSADGHIYIDGDTVATTFGPVGYSEAFTIGYSDYPLYFARKADVASFSSNYFKGALDEVRISKIVRNSFSLTNPLAIDDNTVALWHFDEGTGLTAYDASSNLNHGTVSGATWISRIAPSPTVPEFQLYTAFSVAIAVTLTATILFKKKNASTLLYNN